MELNNLKNINLKIFCPICYFPFDEKKNIITLRCGHYFCDFCLKNLNEKIVSNTNCEIKCSICRTVNHSFNLSNQELIRKFNEFIDSAIIQNSLNVSDENNEIISRNILENWNFCKDCDKLVINLKFINQSDYNYKRKDMMCHNHSHEIVTFQDLFRTIDEIKIKNFNYLFSDRISKDNLKDKLSKLFSMITLCLDGLDNSTKQDSRISGDSKVRDLTQNDLKNYFNKIAENISKLPEVSEKEKRVKIKELHKFKKQLKLLKNPILSQDITSNILNHHNLFKNSKKFIAGFIENTKKVFTFDLSFLEVSTYEIIDLPLHFDKNQNIEYDESTEKFFFLIPEMNYFKINNLTKICEFSVKTNKLKVIKTLDYLLINHRSIVIADFLFIIGGRQKKNSKNGLDKAKEYKCTDEIHVMDKLSYSLKKNIFRLSYPRFNFGLAYDNFNIYICFGEDDAGKFLNNIEIISIRNLSELKLSSSIVNFSDDHLRLTNFGVMVHSNKMIILGGERQNSKANPVIYHLEISDEFKVVDTVQSKKIVSGYFTNYGIGFNSIYGFVSNHTEVSEIPHVYLFSDSNNKWNCHGIDIY